MRKEVQTHLKFVDLLNEWDPFHLKTDGYETEIADVIQAVYELDDLVALAERIQEIYEFSFEQKIPMESCLLIAKELLLVKAEDSCTI
ncbi:DUF1871 family protein [Bacillus sp. BRMEA1]|uniref:DUF1871 family protein n=1 Tax=Neobacillus endophyticus TaxID=2738405 RepID=UPI001566B19E|nr:DUF1871 family protein [Neobacillus endophyticus]NRD76375.1 DUF1871 family protein [Neobacillus endophyticus]